MNPPSLVALLHNPPNLTALDNPLDWEIIKDAASRHGVAQLVAYVARSRVSGAERSWCDQTLARSWKRYSRNLKELEYVAGVLDEAGIKSIVLKGALLAQRHYAPPFLRKPSGDLDLAVRNDDLEKARAVFLNLGYTEGWPLEEARARSHHFELNHPSRPHLELHFRLSHGAYGIPVEEFFERAVPFRLADGREVLIPGAADEILHLILHRAHGRFALLFHLYEIRRIWNAAAPEVRAEALQRAVDHHFAGAFALTDIALQTHWGESLFPDACIPRTWLHSRISRKLYLQFEEWSDPGRELPLSARLGRRWVDFQLTDTPADAARFCGAMLKVAWFQLWRQGWKTVKLAGSEPAQRKG